MGIKERLKTSGRLKEIDLEPTDEFGILLEDDKAEDVLLFARHELPVMLQILGIYGDPQKCYGAFHLISSGHVTASPNRAGWTPEEIAHEMYNDSFDNNEEPYCKMLEAVHDRGIKWMYRETENGDQNDSV